MDVEPIINHAVNPDGADDSDVTPAYRTYRKRYYILVLFSFITALQGAIWNNWGPIATSTEAALGWDNAEISLQSSWGPITYVVSILFFTWIMDARGLRWSTISMTMLVALGAGVRCITMQQPAATYLINLGQFLNGLGGPVAMGAAPLLSAVWFPVHQRTTSTAFVASFNGLGVGAAALAGPSIVRPPLPSPCRNFTDNTTLTLTLPSCSNETAYEARNAEIRWDIKLYMYGQCALAGLFLILVVVYFPAKPPLPPSPSAGVPRVDYVTGLKALLRHKKFWLLGIPYAMATGANAGWGSVLDVILKAPPLNVSQTHVGLIGFTGSLVGIVSGLAVGFAADIFSRRMKLFLLVLLVFAVAPYSLFALVCERVIPYHLWFLFVVNMCGAFSIGALSPLFYELTCESCYPISEGLTNGFLTWLNNVSCLVFLAILWNPGFGSQVRWMNWVLVGFIAVGIPFLVIFKEDYQRVDLDTGRRSRPDDLDPRSRAEQQVHVNQSIQHTYGSYQTS